MVSKVYVATSTDSSDDPLAEFCLQENIPLHRGSLNNVLQRFLDIYKLKPDSKYLVRITGDCPLIDPDFIDCQIDSLHKFNGDICWSPQGSSTLEGANALSWQTLQKIANQYPNEEDKEHVGSPYIAAHPEEFRIVEIGLPAWLLTNQFRLTVDEREDYEVMAAIYNALWEKGKIISLQKTIAWLNQNPQVLVNNTVSHSAINIKVHGQVAKWHNLKKVGSTMFSMTDK